MLHTLAKAELTLPRRYPEQWVVDCKAVGAGAKALTYLGRYLYRGVISEANIVACSNRQVTFRYEDSQTKQIKTRTLPGADFLWLLLQHVLPRRFRRSRNFGFLHPNSKRLIHRLHVLLKVNLATASTYIRPRPVLTCPCCGGPMTIIRTRLPPPSQPDRAAGVPVKAAVM